MNKLLKLEGLQVEVLGLNEFIESLQVSEREKQQVMDHNTPCAVIMREGKPTLLCRNDVYGPSAESYYETLHEILSSLGLNKETIENFWEQLFPEVM